MKRKLIVFDVDKTLTNPGERIGTDMANLLNDIQKKFEIALFTNTGDAILHFQLTQFLQEKCIRVSFKPRLFDEEYTYSRHLEFLTSSRPREDEIVFIGEFLSLRCRELVKNYVFNNVKDIGDTKMILRKLLKQEETVIAVSGYFDPLHSGHIKLFNDAKKLADKLVVIVNNNAQALLRGTPTGMGVDERAFIVGNIKAVDEVVLSIDSDSTVNNTLINIKPNIFANGGDLTLGSLPEGKICKKEGIQMIFNVGGGRPKTNYWICKNADRIITHS